MIKKLFGGFGLIMMMLLVMTMVSAQRIDCPYFLVDNLCVYGVNETMTYAEADAYCGDFGNHTWKVAGLNDYQKVFGACPLNLSPSFTDCAHWLHYEYFYVNGFIQNGNFVPGTYWTSDFLDNHFIYGPITTNVINITEKTVSNVTGFPISEGYTQGVYAEEHLVMCKSLSYAYYVGEISLDDPSTPSWFPNPPVKERGIWILLIIIGIVAFISFSHTGESMLSNPYVGVALILGAMVLFAYLKWISFWLILVLIVLLIGYLYVKMKKGGSE